MEIGFDCFSDLKPEVEPVSPSWLPTFVQAVVLIGGNIATLIVMRDDSMHYLGIFAFANVLLGLTAPITATLVQLFAQKLMRPRLCTTARRRAERLSMN